MYYYLHECRAILDSLALQAVMDSLEDLDCRAHQGQSASLDKTELKEMLERRVKKDLRDPKAL